MVRFIIRTQFLCWHKNIVFTFQYGQIYYVSFTYSFTNKPKIYIPIWLDLLLDKILSGVGHNTKFTFQYGQIYYFNIYFNNKPY